MEQALLNFNGYCSLGVDQSLTGTGLCCRYGDAVVFKKVKPKDLRGAKRLLYIKREIEKFIETLEFFPQVLVMEGYSMDSLNLPFSLGELGGVIKVLAGELGIQLYVVPPSSLKKFVTGKGGASKEEIQVIYGVSDNDLADAQGLAEVGMRLLSKRFLSRAELEVVRSVEANPENNKIVAKRKSSPARQKIYKDQMTCV